MADAASAPTVSVVKGPDGTVTANWGTMTGLATGKVAGLGPIKPGSLSIQLVGAFGSATFVLSGSNDGVAFKTCYLTREQTAAGKQDAASFTADDAAKVAEDAYQYYRVTSSGGTATAVIVNLVARRD